MPSLLNTIVVCVCLLVFFGGAYFVASSQSGERNPVKVFSAMIFGDPADRAEAQKFWDLNPNLTFSRNYSVGSTRIHTPARLTEVRDRESGRTVMLDRAITTKYVRVATVPCESAAAFLPAEIYPGATNQVCFTLLRPDDPDQEFKYRFATSFRAPGKAIPVGNFYDSLIQQRGLQRLVGADDVSVQILEGSLPGVGTMLRVSVFTYAGNTEVFLAASEAFVAHRSEAASPSPASSPGAAIPSQQAAQAAASLDATHMAAKRLESNQQEILATLQAMSKTLPKVPDENVEDQLGAFDMLAHLLSPPQHEVASDLLRQAAEGSPEGPRRERFKIASKAASQGAALTAGWPK